MLKLDNFFNPKSIAIIGASRDRNKLGYQILKNIIYSGFKGRIFPVNPKASIILGKDSYESVLKIPSKIDLAVIIVPNIIIPSIMEDLGKKGVKAVIIISAGFGETGEEGKSIEDNILEIARKNKIRIIGPNCLGVIDTFLPLNASFAAGVPIKKNLAVISQSGAMCSAILDWASKNNIGFSKFISLGNKIDIDEVDLFRALEKDKNSKVILGYFESIKRGTEFIDAASRLSFKKPIIVIKAGLSKEGAKAASSHTGALASNAEVIKAVFNKSGIIQVSDIEELFDFSEAFSVLPMPKDNKVAVLANAGGPSVIAADAISQSNLTLAKFTQNTIKNLKSKMPSSASISNPVDIVGDADAKRFKIAADIILKDKNLSNLIVILTPQTSTEVEKTAKSIVRLKKKFNKSIVASFIGGKAIEKGVQILEKGGIPNFEFPERAVRVLSELIKYKNSRKLISQKKNHVNLQRNKNIEKILEKAGLENRKNLNDLESKIIFNNLKIKTAESSFVKTSKEAIKTASKIGFPVVLKIVSSDVLHKTEYGLVKTNLVNGDEVKKSFEQIIKNAKKLKIKFSGLMVYQTVKSGTELIIGAKRDSLFGPVIMFGLGGIYVQILKDTSFCVAPISKNEAGEMIFKIKGYDLLTGFRGQKPIDIKGLKNIIIKISDLMLAFPEIQELDINPLKAESKNLITLDTKIVLK
ncbi:acyl-CoA synthetase [bacterium CG_4_10_14_0_2_um_filter_33_32]|nr:MAG: acyl-CoA synthetase [bacterium CG_4_10_14_0_2_um_filter_33_32]